MSSASQVQAGLAAWTRVFLFGSVVALLVWLVDRDKKIEFSLPYLVAYNSVCLRVPDLLGNLVIAWFGDARIYGSATIATTAVDLAYMIAMQVFLGLLKWVCDCMGAAHIFPRFHFVAQMYYYLFWYMMLMVMSPGGIEDLNFWIMAAMLNGSSLVSNIGVIRHFGAVTFGKRTPDPPLKILYDSKMAVQDQLADVISLLIVPAISTSIHISASFSVKHSRSGALLSLWTRFGALLAARLVSGLLTESIFQGRLDLLSKVARYFSPLRQ